MGWWWGLGVRSNERALANARDAATTLSRLRVERDEVELYLRHRYAAPRARVAPVALDAAGAEGPR
ncbi:hypothetical protein [Nocardioides sp. GXQ0305]|uniref:hypothetical protein n=1 Tax=Nocardioides sp. GXQ0305 TaxID=3423912 RepID=UPI003D7CDFE1